MKNPMYQLPTMEFIGGENITLRWNLWALSINEQMNKDVPFNANGCTVTFSLIDITNKTGEPIISRKCIPEIGDEGIASTVITYLVPADTVNLRGKYIYQLTIVASDGAAEIPGQGVMYINNNIDRKLVSGGTYLRRI